MKGEQINPYEEEQKNIYNMLHNLMFTEPQVTFNIAWVKCCEI